MECTSLEQLMYLLFCFMVLIEMHWDNLVRKYVFGSWFSKFLLVRPCSYLGNIFYVLFCFVLRLFIYVERESSSVQASRGGA